MKILHLADLHLGKIIDGGLPMIDDQAYILKKIQDVCLEEKIKHIIISGDVYDRSIPPEDAVHLFNNFLTSIVLKNNIKVYLISGNHDSGKRLGCYQELLENAGLIIDTELQEKLKMPIHTITDGRLEINLYSLPYMYPQEIRAKTNNEEIKSFNDMVQKIIDSNEIDNKKINIINTHYFVSGAKLPDRTDSESKKIVGTIEQVSAKLFKNFDYVALGHLHCPQSIDRETIRYAGSPLKYSISEIKQPKYLTIIDIQDKKHINIVKKEIKPLHEFKMFSGKTVEEFCSIKDKSNDIAFFVLSDKKPVLNAAAKLKIKYPFYVGLEYENAKTINAMFNNSVTKSKNFNEKTLEQKFDEFFTFITDRKLSNYQKNIIKEISNEIRKDN